MYKFEGAQKGTQSASGRLREAHRRGQAFLDELDAKWAAIDAAKKAGMPRLPEKLYCVRVSKGEGKSLGYAERGGGTFASLKDAQYRIDTNRKLGRTVRVFVTDCDWNEIDG